MSSLNHVKKVDDLTGGHKKALVTKCGGLPNVIKILRDQKVVQLKDSRVSLFDDYGCRIARNLKSEVSHPKPELEPEPEYYLIQPELDYAERRAYYRERFGEPGISAYGFESWAKALVAKLMANDPLANLLRGMYLPIILPSLPTRFDYGELLEQKFLVLAEEAYGQEFPGRSFVNHHECEFTGKVKVVHKSHRRLITRLRQGPEVALYFPVPLRGFSILASREQMRDLPKEVYLCGGIDICTGMAMYADVLAHDEALGLEMAALSWRSVGRSLGFEAGIDDLHFNSRESLALAFDDYSAGLLFLG